MPRSTGRAAIALSALAAPACGPYDGVGVLVGAPCEAQTVDQLQPGSGRQDVAPDALVWIDLACPAPSATLALHGPDGAVPGTTTLRFGGRQALFVPDAPLVPGTTWEARFDSDDGYRAWSFATGDLGAPVGAPFAGRAVALPAAPAVLAPPGLRAPLLAALAGGFFPVVQVIEEPADGLALVRLGARTGPDAATPQDIDRGTVDARAAVGDPTWGLGPVRLSWTLPAGALLVEDAVLDGIFAADGGGGGGRIEGSWDTRPLAAAFDGDPCDRAAAAGQPCRPCRDDVVACLPLSLRDLAGAPWDGDLVAVDR